MKVADPYVEITGLLTGMELDEGDFCAGKTHLGFSGTVAILSKGYQKEKESRLACRNSLNFLVAGGGFEPPTFGL